MTDEKLKSYVTTYNVEFVVELNDFTEVKIITQYTNPNMISRPEDKSEVARVDYDNMKNTNLKILYDKVSNEMNFYKEDFVNKVKTRLIDTQIEPTENFGKGYTVRQITTLSDKDEIDITQDDEITLLAQNSNHQIRDELEKTVDELEEEVIDELNGKP
tara:strand:- start:818 stop:1294 length:477 start_codon:yes stop_codon:yes gene_type:complete